MDQIKLSMTGEEITGTQRAEDTYMSDEEVAAAVTEAHRRGKRVCAYARSAGSVKMCVRDGVGIVYHASFTDEEGLDLLESAKDWIFVAPLGLGLRRPTAYYPLLARAATAIFGDTPMGLRVAATLAAVAPIVRELGGGRGA